MEIKDLITIGQTYDKYLVLVLHHCYKLVQKSYLSCLRGEYTTEITEDILPIIQQYIQSFIEHINMVEQLPPEELPEWMLPNYLPQRIVAHDISKQVNQYSSILSSSEAIFAANTILLRLLGRFSGTHANDVEDTNS